MKITERKRALFAALEDDPDAGADAAALVSALRHDLGNLVGTMTMELHLVGRLVDELRDSALRRDYERCMRHVDELAEIHQNLSEVGVRAKELLAELESSG